MSDNMKKVSNTLIGADGIITITGGSLDGHSATKYRFITPVYPHHHVGYINIIPEKQADGAWGRIPTLLDMGDNDGDELQEKVEVKDLLPEYLRNLELLGVQAETQSDMLENDINSTFDSEPLGDEWLD